ncbi:MAG: hypothetical protein Q8K75_02660 [Chlamydiales bacterium]|nr:hypothetical protein [Chlamydiales bacterium]
MARALTIIVILALAAAGYLIFMNYDGSYQVLPKVEHEEKVEDEVQTEDPFGEWRPFSSEDGVFTVMLPSLPQRANDTIADPSTGEQRKYDMYVAKKSNGSIFMISMITYPGSGGLEDHKILESVKDEMVAAHPGNKLLSSQTGTYLGHDSIDFSIENPDAHIDGKAFLVDRTLYLLTHVASKDTYNEQEFGHFADSFKINTQK